MSSAVAAALCPRTHASRLLDEKEDKVLRAIGSCSIGFGRWICRVCLVGSGGHKLFLENVKKVKRDFLKNMFYER